MDNSLSAEILKHVCRQYRLANQEVNQGETIQKERACGQRTVQQPTVSLSLSLAKSDSPREGSPPRTGSLFAGSRNSAVPGRLEDARAGLEVTRYREPRRRLAVRWELLPRI